MFKIDTDLVDSAISDINTAASALQDCSSSIQGYDVSCEDDFPFDVAKASIMNSVQICQEKVSNTATALQKVNQIHSDLQTTLAEGKYEDKPPEQPSSSSSGTSSSGYTGGGSSRGGYSGGGHSSGGHSSSSYSGGSHSTGVSAITSAVGSSAATAALTNKLTDDDIDADLSQLTESEINAGVVDYVYIPASVGIETLPSSYSDEQKTIFENTNLITDNDGYLKLDNRYIISCNSSIGKVGDIVTITTKTGSNVECVIGSVNENNNINMFINNTGTVKINNSVTGGFTNNIQSITNNTLASTNTNINTSSSETSAAGVVAGAVAPITSTPTNDLNKDNTNDIVNDNSNGSEQE